MNVEVGSNVFTNTDGIIEVEGVPQLQVALRQPGPRLLVSFAMFDEAGRMLAKLTDSTLMFNERRAYELVKTQEGLTLRHTESGKVVLQVEARGADTVALTKGEFRSIKGHLVEISGKEWKIDKRRSSGATTDAKGGAVQLG